MRAPDLEALVQDAEDQAAGNDALVRALLCIKSDLSSLTIDQEYHIYPYTLQVRAEAAGRKHRVDVTPGLKALVARYEHTEDDRQQYRIGRLRDLIDQITSESEDTK